MFSVKTLLVLSAIMASTLAFNLEEFTDLEINEVTELQNQVTNQSGYRCEFVVAKKYKVGKYQYYAAVVETDDSGGDCFVLFMVNFSDNPPALKFYDDNSEGFEAIRADLNEETCSADVQVGMFGQFSIKYPKLSQPEFFNKQKQSMGLYKLGMGNQSEQELMFEAQTNETSMGEMSQMKKLAKGNNYGSWAQIRGENAEPYQKIFENTLFNNKVGGVYRTNAGKYVFVFEMKGEEEYNCRLWLRDLGYPKGYEVVEEETRPILNCAFLKEMNDCSMQIHEHILDSVNQQALIVFKPIVYDDNVWYKSGNGLDSISVGGEIFGFGAKYKFTDKFAFLKKEKRRFYVGEMYDKTDQNFVKCLLFITSPTGNTKDLILLKVPVDQLPQFGGNFFQGTVPCPDDFVVSIKSIVSERRVKTYINIITTSSQNNLLKPGFALLDNDELSSLKQVVEEVYPDYNVRGGLKRTVTGGTENIVLMTYMQGMNYCKIVIFVSEEDSRVKFGSPASSKTKAYDGTFINAPNCGIQMFSKITSSIFIPIRRLLLI